MDRKIYIFCASEGEKDVEFIRVPRWGAETFDDLELAKEHVERNVRNFLETFKEATVERYEGTEGYFATITLHGHETRFEAILTFFHGKKD